MKHAILILMLLMVSSCKKPCDDPASLPSLVSKSVIKEWDCKNEVAVRRDITKWMAERNFCEESHGKQGVFADLVCPFIAEKLRQAFASRVPAEWQCDPALIGQNGAAALTAVCEMIPY